MARFDQILKNILSELDTFGGVADVTQRGGDFLDPTTGQPIDLSIQPATIGRATTPPQRQLGFQQAPEALGTKILDPESQFFDLPSEEQERVRLSLKFLGEEKTKEIFGVTPPEKPFGKFAGATSQFFAGLTGAEQDPVEASSPTLNALFRLGGEVTKFTNLIGAAKSFGAKVAVAEGFAGLGSAIERETSKALTEEKPEDKLTADELLEKRSGDSEFSKAIENIGLETILAVVGGTLLPTSTKVVGKTPKSATIMNRVDDIPLPPTAKSVNPIDDLIVNDRAAPSPNIVGAPHTILETPAVTRGELRVMESGAKTSQTTTSKVLTFDGGIETGLRLHERWGTKGIMYNTWRKASNDATKQFRSLSNEFRGIVKDNFSLRNRGESSERIGIFATAQQRGGAKVLREMGITKIPELTSAETETYLFMREKLKGMYDDLQVARRKSGISPFPETRDYFTFWRSVDGEVQNGSDVYKTFSDAFTLRVDKNQLRATKQTPFGFAKKRIVDKYGEIELDSFKTFEKYMDRAYEHKELTPVIAKNRQLLSGKFTNKFALESENPQMFKELDTWNNFIAGVPPISEISQINRARMRTLTQNLAWSVLGYNVRSAAIQPTAIVGSFAELGGKWILEGVNRSLPGKNSLRRFALSKSNHLSSREFDISIQESFNSLGSLRKQIGAAGIKGLQILDKETAVVTWVGAFQKGKKFLKMTEKEAVSFADDTVIRTQASAAKGDISPLQRTALGKFISPFNTFVINNWGFLTRDVAGLGSGAKFNATNFGKVARYMAGASAVNTLYENGFGMRSPLPSPITAFNESLNKDQNLAKAFGSAVIELTEIVPIVGNVRYSSNPLGAAVELLGDISKIPKRSSTRKTLQTVGKTLGVPGTTQISKTIKFFEGSFNIQNLRDGGSGRKMKKKR